MILKNNALGILYICAFVMSFERDISRPSIDVQKNNFKKANTAIAPTPKGLNVKRSNERSEIIAFQAKVSATETFA